MKYPREETCPTAGDRRLRRLIGLAAFGGVLVAGVWILPRILPRSPATIVVTCVLAVVAMKLVEGRLYRWLRQLGGQGEPGAGPR